jgi:hypothetical protein
MAKVDLVPLVYLVCLVQRKKRDRPDKQESPEILALHGLTSFPARGTACTIIIGQGVLTLRPSQKGHHYEKRRDDCRGKHIDDQGRFDQRLWTFCIGKDHHHCFNRRECHYYKPRRKGWTERVPEKITCRRRPHQWGRPAKTRNL